MKQMRRNICTYAIYEFCHENVMYICTTYVLLRAQQKTRSNISQYNTLPFESNKKKIASYAAPTPPSFSLSASCT